MTLVAMFSEKGSPGVTTLSLALATVWPRPVVLAELDPAGGDLALRLTDSDGMPALPGTPGVLALAAACRGGGVPQLREHTRPLPGAPASSVVLSGVADAEQAAGIASLWPDLTAALAEYAAEHPEENSTGHAGADVLADLGRLHPGSPAVAVAERADLLVGVGRGDAEGMLRLRDRMCHLLAGRPTAVDGDGRRALVVLVGEDRRAEEAAAAMRTVLAHAGLPVEVAGCLAHDPAAVTDLHHGGVSGRTHRSLLLRSARGLVPALIGAPTPGAPAQAARRSFRRPTLAGAR